MTEFDISLEVDHSPFISSATAFKRQLQQSGSFTPTEIASMLGAFVITQYSIQTIQPVSPEQLRLLTNMNKYLGSDDD